MSELSRLSPPPGAVKKKKRKGRGESSGWGKTAGKGNKGSKARQGGGKPALGFEGGQMPLARRLPKRGFKSLNRIEYVVINLGDLESFEAGTVVDLNELRSRGLVKKRGERLKVLADGELKAGVTIRAHRFSQAAVEKVAAAGGSIELIEA
jgi:large subunit ribosomal protein L15